MKLKISINILIIVLLTNPVNAGFDDVWRQRIARPPQEVGMASIYRDHRTASGDLFNGKALTCAHRTRPMCDLASFRKGICPTRSIVTVRHAGKAVECRVNDRGPYRAGRILDLSGASARALGLSWEQGVGKVELD